MDDVWTETSQLPPQAPDRPQPAHIAWQLQDFDAGGGKSLRD
jgi:hypothetical protein